MKKILIIIPLCLFLSSNVDAELETLPEETTVNSLIKNGYRIIDTGATSKSLLYHLMKGKNLVTCEIANGEINCIKP